MSSGYGIGAMNSLGYDPAFLAAYSAYNPNFKASQDTAQAQAYAQALAEAQAAAGGSSTSTQQSTTASNAYMSAPPPSDNTGMIVGGALATAATVGGLIYAAKRGNGEGVIAGLKNIFGGAKKALSSQATKQMKEFKYIAKDGSKVTVKDGKITNVAIMGKNTVLKDTTAIKKHLTDKGITIPNYLNGTQLHKGVKLTEYTIKFGDDRFVVKDGKIIKAIKQNNSEYTKNELKNFINSNKYKGDLKQKITSIENGTSSKMDKYNLENVRYTWENGDYTYYGCANGGNPTRITIAGKRNYKTTEAEWKDWLYRNDDINKQVKEIIANGRAEGVSVRDFRYTDEKGNVLFMDDKGEIIKILLKNKPKKGSQTMSKGTVEFGEWLYNNQGIKEAAKKEFETGLAPDGATFIVA